MYRQLVLLIILSALAVMFMSELRYVLQFFSHAQAFMAGKLGEIIAGGRAGFVIRHTLALIAIPIIVGLVVHVIYYFIKKGAPPYLMHIVWVTWIVITTTVLLVR